MIKLLSISGLLRVLVYTGRYGGQVTLFFHVRLREDLKMILFISSSFSVLRATVIIKDIDNDRVRSLHSIQSTDCVRGCYFIHSILPSSGSMIYSSSCSWAHKLPMGELVLDSLRPSPPPSPSISPSPVVPTLADSPTRRLKPD